MKRLGNPAFLLHWWLRRLHFDVAQGLRDWTHEPEQPLLWMGLLFFMSFLLHWMGYRLALHRVGWPTPLFAPTEWEGRTGWRKPLVFGISTAMVFVSLRFALKAQRLVPRGKTASLAAWSAFVEVGIITMQAWRGVPSHFNTATRLDAALYGVKLASVLLLSVACAASAAGVLVRSAHRSTPSAQLVALRHGLLLMCVSVAIGFAQVMYGHLPREAREEEIARCLEVTAGSHRSPCYEIHGEAAVKLAHFLPLHATEALLLLAWATRRAGLGAAGSRLVGASAFGCWALAAIGLWTVADGMDLKNPTTSVATLMVMSFCFIVAPFVLVFLAPRTLRTQKICDEPCPASWLADMGSCDGGSVGG